MKETTKTIKAEIKTIPEFVRPSLDDNNNGIKDVISIQENISNIGDVFLFQVMCLVCVATPLQRKNIMIFFVMVLQNLNNDILIK